MPVGRKQLAGQSGFGLRERSHHARECGSVALLTKHECKAHRPRRNCDLRDADPPTSINSPQLLEVAVGGVGIRHWNYSSNVPLNYVERRVPLQRCLPQPSVECWWARHTEKRPRQELELSIRLVARSCAVLL